jgi:type II secretory pathway predicted ATPase ExeA
VRAFTASLDANSYLVIYLANPTTGIVGVYRDLLLTLGHQPPFSKPRMVAAVRAALTDLRINKRRAPNEAFYQRLAMRYHLGPLDLQETIGYVRHHAKVAGYTTGQLFTDDAVTRIFEYTKGLPRRINQLCHTALMAGLIDQKSILDENTIRKATPALRSGASVADIDHD